MICLFQNAELDGLVKVECYCAFFPSDRFRSTDLLAYLFPNPERVIHI